MPTPYERAGAALGELLLGGDKARGAKAYGEGLQQGYTIDRAMQEAGRSRSRRLIDEQRLAQREALAGTETDLFANVGYSPAEAALVRALVLSGETPNLRNAGVFERPGAQDAFALARGVLGEDPSGAEIMAANRAQQFIAGKEYDPVVISDGVIRNRGIALGDPEFQVQSTPRAAAQIAQGNQRVQIQQQRASARGGSRASSGKPPTTSQVEGQVLEQARQRIADGADPKAVADYLTRKGYPGVAKRVYTPPKATAGALGDDGF